MARVIRWGGMALILGGLSYVVATLLHPPQETATTILETETRLVGSHALSLVSYLLILLGLPALYSEQDLWDRRGAAGFLTTFTGTFLLAVSSNFGFLAPVLAAEAPATLDQILQYQPVVILNGIAAVAFMVGFVILGSVIVSSEVFPRWPGVLIAVGAPVNLIGFAVSQLVSPTFYFIAILGAVAFGVGLTWCGQSLRNRSAPRLAA